MYMNNIVDAVHGVNMTVKEDVIKAMKELKAEGAIVSPVRCKWEPAQ